MELKLTTVYDRNDKSQHTQDTDSGPRFLGFPAGTRGKSVVSGGKTLEIGRKVEAVIR
jgi:hypothetical protein